MYEERFELTNNKTAFNSACKCADAYLHWFIYMSLSVVLHQTLSRKEEGAKRANITKKGVVSMIRRVPI